MNIKMLLSFFAADIDIFLLQNEDQKSDKEKDDYTKEEIRNQLKNSIEKFSKQLPRLGFDMDKELEFDENLYLGYLLNIRKS
jgi:hypothetical protein